MFGHFFQNFKFWLKLLNLLKNTMRGGGLAIYLYIYIIYTYLVCACVCVCAESRKRNGEALSKFQKHKKYECVDKK